MRGRGLEGPEGEGPTPPPEMWGHIPADWALLEETHWAEEDSRSVGVVIWEAAVCPEETALSSGTLRAHSPGT